jgi:hypothetical protein
VTVLSGVNSSLRPQDKNRASAGSRGQFLSVLKDDFLDSLIKINLSSINLLFEVLITLGFKSDVSKFFKFLSRKNGKKNHEG